MDIRLIVLGLDVMRQAAPGNLGRRGWTAGCLDGGKRQLLRPEVLETHPGSAGWAVKEEGEWEERWLTGVSQSLLFGTRFWRHKKGGWRRPEGPAGWEDDDQNFSLDEQEMSWKKSELRKGLKNCLNQLTVTKPRVTAGSSKNSKHEKFVTPILPQSNRDQFSQWYNDQCFFRFK